MHFQIGFTGLSEFAEHLDDLANFSEVLSGELAKPTFDHDDPESVEKAVRTLETEIDRRLAPFRRNRTAAAMAEEVKRQCAEEIRGFRLEP